jgi:hypothetical protein
MSEAGSVGAVSPDQFAALLHKSSSPSPSHVSAVCIVVASRKTSCGPHHFAAFRYRNVIAVKD